MLTIVSNDFLFERLKRVLEVRTKASNEEDKANDEEVKEIKGHLDKGDDRQTKEETELTSSKKVFLGNALLSRN